MGGAPARHRPRRRHDDLLQHRPAQPPRRDRAHLARPSSAQRTAVNTAAKLLLLGHAFEECDAIAVEFRTHWHNRQSREAIARLGAKQDGVLRNHRLGPDGTLRDTVVFSILPHEWPAVRLGLQERLARG